MTERAASPLSHTTMIRFRRLRGCAQDLLGLAVLSLCVLAALVTCSRVMPRADAAQATGAPAPIVWNYHPNATGDRFARVFVNRAVEPTLPFRPWRMILNGGGFMPGTGAPGNYNPGADALLDHWYAQGDVVIFLGYTTHEPALPNEGAFNPALWATNGASDLVLDQASVASPHAEADICHAIQVLRFSGIAGIPDLDRRDARGIVYGRSAGSMTAWWVSGGVDRANTANVDPRYRVSTTVAASIHHPTIVHLSAFPTTWNQVHLPDALGNVPAQLGTVPLSTQAESSVLRWGWRPKPPCFCTTLDAQLFHGPHNWANFRHVLPLSPLHTADHVIAAAELPGLGLGSFFDETPQGVAAANPARVAWVDAIELALQ